jgi:hypothetical protein
MASSYPAFEVKVDNDDGTTTLLPLQTVHVYDATNLVALTDVVSDATGVVPAGSVTPGAGTLLRFWFYIPASAAPDPLVGVCGFSEVFTT